MPRAIWSGVISFGLVSIPVKLYTATESKSISFHMLHKECKTRIKQQKWCPHCEKQIEYDDTEKGYEYSKGNYVVVTEEDLEKLPLPSKNIINISAFVNAEQIDPVYFDGSYYLEPEKVAQKPYMLFTTAMQDKGVVAIGTLAIRNKERLCSLRCLGGNLMVDMLLYPDEVRVDPEKEAPDVKLSPQELAMASSLIDIMEQDFHPENYKDNYREALSEMIQAKLDGSEMVAAPEAAPSKVIDLMDALRASVENAKSAKQRSAGPQEAEENVLRASRKQITQAAHTKADDNETTAKKPASKAKKKTGVA
jgi:DNA end-binding protein Ku